MGIAKILVEGLWPPGAIHEVTQINFPYMGGCLNYGTSMADDKPLLKELLKNGQETLIILTSLLGIVVSLKTGQNVRDAYSKIGSESFDSKSGTIKTEN